MLELHAIFQILHFYWSQIIRASSFLLNYVQCRDWSHLKVTLCENLDTRKIFDSLCYRTALRVVWEVYDGTDAVCLPHANLARDATALALPYIS